MAYKLTYMNGPGDVQDEDGVIMKFVCDKESDVSSLPTGDNESDWTKKPRPGSRAVIAETQTEYILDTTRTWVTKS